MTLTPITSRCNIPNRAEAERAGNPDSTGDYL